MFISESRDRRRHLESRKCKTSFIQKKTRLFLEPPDSSASLLASSSSIAVPLQSNSHILLSCSQLGGRASLQHAAAAVNAKHATERIHHRLVFICCSQRTRARTWKQTGRIFSFWQQVCHRNGVTWSFYCASRRDKLDACTLRRQDRNLMDERKTSSHPSGEEK